MPRFAMIRTALPVLVFGLLSQPGWAASAADTAILPPLPQAGAWSGASRSLIAPPGDRWITPAEKDGFVHSPSYADTVAWLRALDEASKQVAMVSLGKSPEGRDLWLVVVSAEGAATPEALRKNGKPTLFAQAGIHSGEIDGKDAGMMLLRDLTVRGSRKALLTGANFLFVPIFSVDAHERASRFGRINQRGPEVTGWRTTARNLNLNRDYMKLDAPEMRMLVGALDTWQPDLAFDLHVTDGVDYQYDITWGAPGRTGYSPQAAAWLETVLNPALKRDLAAMGHIPGTLIFPVAGEDFSQGLGRWNSQPRFSDGYGALRHLPTVLVENHSLKPYEQRVLGTYVLLAGALETLGRDGKALRRATEADRALRPAELPLSFKAAAGDPPQVEFLAIRSRREPSAVSGAEKIVWTGEPETVQMPMVQLTAPDVVVRRPKAYWVPAAWTEVIARLALHGIRMERQAEKREVEVEMYRVEDAKLDAEPFEGHVHVTATPVPERRRATFAAGSVRVSTDQPLGDLAILLLEPASADSFFQWGFFLEILNRTEYAEAYVMEPMAEKMLAEDPVLAAAFKAALESDPKLAADRQERLLWFYRRTPFFDDQWRLYPVGREL